jgi:probable HAF family extracellular repeat protein
MITLSLRRTCLAGIACLVGSAASAAPYTTTILTYPGALETYPLAENNAGTVIGYWLDSNYGQHGFIYQDGTLSDFNPPNATGSIPSGINDKGDVVGYFTDSSQNTHGYLYKATTGKFKTVDLAGSGYTTLNLINRQGVAVGFGIDSGGYGEIFTYAHGVFTTAIDNQEQPAAYGVNHLGTIVGTRGKPPSPIRTAK